MKKKFLACALAATLFLATGAVATSATTNESQSSLPVSTIVGDRTATITANNVCFRKGPSTSSSIIRYFSKGTTVTVTYGPFSTGQYSWYKVVYDNTTGYVCSDYVS